MPEHFGHIAFALWWGDVSWMFMQVWLTYFGVHDPWRPLHALTSCTVDPFCWRRGTLGLKSVDCSQDESKTHPISPTCYKHALKTFLLHVLFTGFFFNCQGVAKQQAEYAKIDEAESRRIEWIHRQEIKGPKPEVPGIVRSLWEAGSHFLEMKKMYIYIYTCVCMCCSADLLMLLFSPLFSQLCKTPVPCLHWLLARIFDDSEATMKQDCESLDDQSEYYCFHDTHDS